MKKTIMVAIVAVSAVLGLAALAGCSGGTTTPSSNTNNSNSSASTAQTNTSNENASSSATDGRAGTTANTTTTTTSADRSTTDGAILEIDGAELTSMEVVMVGDTPNFQPIFANNTPQDIEVDLSKFKIVKDDGTEANFHLTTKVIKANTPYSQNTFTTTPGSMKVGDKLSISYDGQDLGTYEVGEF